MCICIYISLFNVCYLFTVLFLWYNYFIWVKIYLILELIRSFFIILSFKINNVTTQKLFNRHLRKWITRLYNDFISHYCYRVEHNMMIQMNSVWWLNIFYYFLKVDFSLKHYFWVSTDMWQRQVFTLWYVLRG